MTNKYDNLRLNVVLDRIKDKNILTKTADVICRMRENVDCPNFFYIPADCMSDMDYVIAAINYIITSFGYKAHWYFLALYPFSAFLRNKKFGAMRHTYL